MAEAEKVLMNIDDVVFPDGLIGLPEWKTYRLQQTIDMIPVALLHSKDAKGLSFIVASPAGWYPDYRFDISDEDMKKIKAKKVEDLLVLAIINVESEPFTITANLISPLVINPETGLGIQLLLEKSPYIPNQPLTLKTLLVTLKEGLIGLPEWKNYVLQIVNELMPVMLLVSKDEKRVSFPVIDPMLIDGDFVPKLSKKDQMDLGVRSIKDAVWFVVLDVKNQPLEVTANMLAPIVINPRTGVGKQIIISSGTYNNVTPIKTIELIQKAVK